MKKFLSILKLVLFLVFIVFAVAFIIHLVMAISKACFANDIITAQDRTEASHYFLAGVASIAVAAGSLIGVSFIKEKYIFQDFVVGLFNKIFKKNK